jgi:hypothetical protein
MHAPVEKKIAGAGMPTTAVNCVRRGKDAIVVESLDRIMQFAPTS